MPPAPTTETGQTDASRPITSELESLQQERLQLEAQVYNLHRANALLGTIGSLIASSTNLADFMQRSCGIIVERGGFELAWVGLVSGSTNTIQPLASAGRGAESLEAVDISSLDADSVENPVRRAILEMRFAVVNLDNSSGCIVPGFSRTAQPVFSALAVQPILSGGVVRGILSLYAGTPGRFDKAEQLLLEGLAGILASAIVFFLEQEQRRLANQAVMDAERRYRVAQRASHIASWEWDISGEMISWSDEMFGIYEKDPSVFLPTSQAVVDNILEEDRTRVAEIIDSALAKGTPLHAEYRIRDRKNAVKWVEMRGEVVFDAGHHPIRAAGTVQDITSRKLAETALTHSRDLMHYIIDHDRSCVAVHDRDLRYVFVSQRYLDEYEVKDRDVIGKHHYDVFPDLPQKWRDVHQRALRGEISSGEDDPYSRADGTVDYTRWECRPWYESDGSIGGIIVYTEIITKRKRAEEMLRESEQRYRTLNTELEKRVLERTAQLEASNKELEAFAYSVSHDLRAPLRAIDGFSRIVQQQYAGILDDEGKRLLEVIRHNTGKMDRLIIDLLALSRVTRSQLNCSCIDMTSMANTIYQEFATPEVIQKFIFHVGALPKVFADPTLIQQVWTNLVSNAIKYTLPMPECRVEISGYEKDGFCTYSISDNGVGFNPKYSDKLFGLFQRLHRESEFEGNGVGLAIVHRIILRHGGRIWAESEVGKGASFYFSLPSR